MRRSGSSGNKSEKSSNDASGKTEKTRQKSPRIKGNKQRHDRYRSLHEARTHAYRNRPKWHSMRVRHRAASTYPESHSRPLLADRSISDTTTLTTITGREETELADSPSTSSEGSKKKTKISHSPIRSQIKKRPVCDRMVKKGRDDDDVINSSASNASHASSSHQTDVTKAERAIANVLLTQEDSQPSQKSIVEGQVRCYETNMQKRVKEFTNYCLRTSMEVLTAQYEQLQAIKPSKANAFIGMLPVNHHKNRYVDICCLDSTRVILRRPGSDYIHANYIRHQVLQNDFILTQGPLPNTVSDFWQMVWQERSGLIFMLCKFVEDHKVKCADYLPTLQSRVIVHGGIRIELRERSTSKNGNIIMTQLLLSHELANLTVVHYQWTSWADHQVPANDYKTPFYLLKKSRISPTCTVVHCSAGVGRSGTLVAIELCLMQLVAGNELVVPDMVAYIRRRRAQSVQTREQYLYIFRALLDFAVSNHIVCARKINPFVEKYQQICANDESH